MPTAASDCLFRPKEVRSEQREHKKYNDPGEKGVMLSQKPQSQKHASNQAVPTPGRFSTFPYMKQWTYGLESRARKAAFLHVLCPSLVFREIRAAALGLPVHFPVWDREDRGGWSCALGGSRPGSDSHAGEPLGRASRIFGLERVPSTQKRKEGTEGGREVGRKEGKKKREKEGGGERERNLSTPPTSTFRETERVFFTQHKLSNRRGLFSATQTLLGLLGIPHPATLKSEG